MQRKSRSVGKTQGRPSKFSDEIAHAICQRIASTDLGLSRIAQELKLNPDTIYAWLAKFPSFSEKYARAREVQQDFMAEQILEIADDATRDTKTIKRGETEVEIADNEWINRSRLRVETRKWLMSKLNPKKYGDKVQQEISGKDGADLTLKVIHVGRAAD